jgi:GxxExxY protein
MEGHKLTRDIIGAAIEVHRELGPGLLEYVYETCLEYVLIKKGFKVDRQPGLPVRFKEILFDVGYRADLIVNDTVLLELKSVEEIHPKHIARVLTYLRFSGHRLGLLINFNVDCLRDGIRRLVR